jgi:hypothetical protein
MNRHLSRFHRLSALILICLLSVGGEVTANDVLDAKLCSAAEKGVATDVENLLKKGASPDADCLGGAYVLRVAAEKDFLPIVALLLKAGADTLPYESGRPWPTLLYARSGSVAKLILRSGKEFDSEMLWYLIKWFEGDKNVRLEIAEQLLKAGADPRDTKGKGLHSALPEAINDSDVALVTLLLKYGARVDQLDSTGKTPLDYARIKNDASIIELIRARGGKEGSFRKSDPRKVERRDGAANPFWGIGILEVSHGVSNFANLPATDKVRGGYLRDFQLYTHSDCTLDVYNFEADCVAQKGSSGSPIYTLENGSLHVLILEAHGSRRGRGDAEINGQVIGGEITYQLLSSRLSMCDFSDSVYGREVGGRDFCKTAQQLIEQDWRLPMSASISWCLGRVEGMVDRETAITACHKLINTPAISDSLRAVSYASIGTLENGRSVIDPAKVKMNYSEALAVTNEAIKKGVGDNISYYSYRCWLRALLSEQLSDAISDCNRALVSDPKDTRSLSSRGLVYLRLGKLELAHSDFSSGIKINPRSPDDLFRRGITRKRLAKDGWEKDIQAAEKLSPNIKEKSATFDITL